MNSKERVRKAICHKETDYVPADYWAIPEATAKLMKHFQTENIDDVYNQLKTDIVWIEPKYIGPELKTYREGDDIIRETFFGNYLRFHWNGFEYNALAHYLPLDEMTTVKEVEGYRWPNPDWFDYESLKPLCDRYQDKAILIGDQGVYQYATFMRSAEKLYMDMLLEPELAKAIFRKFSEFEVEYYGRMMEACDGQFDILRVCDDYGTQNSMLFSREMWDEFFAENTKKLTVLSHKHGGYYMQHSCGAVRPIIPNLIECGVDILNPLQKVVGLEPQSLKDEFGDRICFQGGIDTQFLLPQGTPEEVDKEARKYIEILGKNGGYILNGSQALEGDVPVENIIAMYNARF